MGGVVVDGKNYYYLPKNSLPHSEVSSNSLQNVITYLAHKHIAKKLRKHLTIAKAYIQTVSNNLFHFDYSNPFTNRTRLTKKFIKKKVTVY